MKRQNPHARMPFHRLLIATAPVLLAVTLALSGCATRQQVATIVTQSNAAMLAGQYGLPAPNPSGTNASWQLESERIDAFIAAHPNQESTTAPLRIRQAMLLLAHGQFHLAAAAFNEVQLDQLHADRDKALKRNQGTLLWWFARSTSENWTETDWKQARAALDALAQEQALCAGSPEIRDYLAELRAWIGLSAARQTSSEARHFLEDALDVYARVFTADDLVALLTDQEQLADPKAVGTEIRRRLRAKAVIAFAREQNERDELGAHPANRTLDRLLNRR